MPVKKTAVPPEIYQLKVTLREIKPPIWRRIQVRDCTLDKLHERIQTAMGWTNSHLHHFQVNDVLYGDPWLLDENFAEMNYKDSRTTMLSKILPKSGQRFQFASRANELAQALALRTSACARFATVLGARYMG